MAVTTATTIKVTSPAAHSSHPDHFQLIFGAILAALQASVPLIVQLVPPEVGVGLEAGTALAPTVVQVVEAVKAADAGAAPVQSQ
jgi:hypothetical protein